MEFDEDEIDLVLCLLKWTRQEAINSRGELKAYDAAFPLSAWGLERMDALIASLEQYQKDIIKEKADG